MIKRPINIVWLKRDLRTQDHLPFALAESEGIPFIAIYILEPSALKAPDSSLRHTQFVYHSIEDVNRSLASYGKRVSLLYGEAVEVFECLIETYSIENIFSYQESGTQATWVRDKAVKRLFNAHGIRWNESQRDGIVRGARNRDGWDKQWYITMNESCTSNTFNHLTHVIEFPQFQLPDETVYTTESIPQCLPTCRRIPSLEVPSHFH